MVFLYMCWHQLKISWFKWLSLSFPVSLDCLWIPHSLHLFLSSHLACILSKQLKKKKKLNNTVRKSTKRSLWLKVLTEFLNSAYLNDWANSIPIMAMTPASCRLKHWTLLARHCLLSKFGLIFCTCSFEISARRPKKPCKFIRTLFPWRKSFRREASTRLYLSF